MGLRRDVGQCEWLRPLGGAGEGHWPLGAKCPAGKAGFRGLLVTGPWELSLRHLGPTQCEESRGGLLPSRQAPTPLHGGSTLLEAQELVGRMHPSPFVDEAGLGSVGGPCRRAGKGQQQRPSRPHRPVWEPPATGGPWEAETLNF